MNSEVYDKEHIPGSILWSTFNLLQPSLKILEAEAMSKLLSNSGIDRNTTVVAIHNNSLTSGWIFWLLELCGRRNIRILNRGYPKWQKENFPLTIDKTEVKPVYYQFCEYQNYLRVFTTELKESIARNNCLLLDVRTPQEYKGEIYLLEPLKAGEKARHIPGAVNIGYELAHNENGTFKSADELKIYGDSISTNKIIITDCAIGARSTQIWLVLKYLLGCDPKANGAIRARSNFASLGCCERNRAKNYDGSWNKWSRLSNAPIAN